MFRVEISRSWRNRARRGKVVAVAIRTAKSGLVAGVAGRRRYVQVHIDCAVVVASAIQLRFRRAELTASSSIASIEVKAEAAVVCGLSLHQRRAGIGADECAGAQ